MMIKPIDGDPPLDGILRDGDVGHAPRQHLPPLRVVIHITPVLGVAVAVLKLHLCPVLLVTDPGPCQLMASLATGPGPLRGLEPQAPATRGSQESARVRPCETILFPILFIVLMFAFSLIK